MMGLLDLLLGSLKSLGPMDTVSALRRVPGGPTPRSQARAGRVREGHACPNAGRATSKRLQLWILNKLGDDK